MTEAATRLIETFRSLPPADRSAVLAELGRCEDLATEPVGDNEMVSAGVELFAMYDEEEDASAAG